MPFSCKVSDQGASFRFLGEGTEAEEMSDLSPMADRGRSGLRPSRCMTLEHDLGQCSFWLREAEATLCRLLLPVTLSPEFTFTCFYFQRNPHCAWEGHPAEGCSEPDWDKHRRRGPVLSLPLYCPGMRRTLEVGAGSWVEQVSAFLVGDRRRFISPLRKPGCRGWEMALSGECVPCRLEQRGSVSGA